MKELIFVRHAKSDWENESVKDIDRHLNERGYRDAYDMGEWFEHTHPKPDAILSSTATRALNTALIVARSMQFPMNHFYLHEQLYEVRLPVLTDFLLRLPEPFNRVMLFGHNPATTEVCNELAEDWYCDNIPTCGLVSMQFKIEHWKDLRSKTGKILYYRFPKEFKQ